MLAIAFLDGQVMPEQYETDRINSDDVQQLLQKVDVQVSDEYSDRFPQEMACRIEIETNDGTIFSVEKQDYEGFTTNPASWGVLLKKYHSLTQHIDQQLADQIATTIEHIDEVDIVELTALLSQVRVLNGGV